MEYVMVPVPEEVAEQVRNYVRWGLGRGADLASQDPGVVVRVLRDTDDESRRLVRDIANAMVDETPRTVAELSARANLSVREVRGTIAEFNQRVAMEGGPPAPVWVKPAQEGSGGFSPGEVIPTIPPKLAKLVVAAAKAEREAEEVVGEGPGSA